jgi:hypothetical protein
MVRRIATTVTALLVAFAIYATFICLILHRVSKMIHVTVVRVPGARGAAEGYVLIFGVPIHYSFFLAAAATALALLLLADLMNRLRRTRRAENDECVECGRPITSWRGRCPGCGVRVGPG